MGLLVLQVPLAKSTIFCGREPGWGERVEHT